MKDYFLESEKNDFKTGSKCTGCHDSGRVLGKIFGGRERLQKKFVVENREEARKKEIFARLDELFAREKPISEDQKRAIHENNEKLINFVDSASKIVGDDAPWASEEEMIEELARDRRERWKNAC